MIKRGLLFTGFAILFFNGYAQGLEDIIVEEYYINTGKEKKDSFLPEGSVTYRIYVDMLPGYRLQAIYGSPGHPMRFSTSTYFHNDTIWQIQIAQQVQQILINQHALCFDSWITMGAASARHLGILKAEDPDGSILLEKSMAEADGLMEGRAGSIVINELDLVGFETSSMSEFSTENGAWALLEGIQGPTPENRVLIGQFTTTGIFSFEFNLQILKPDCGDGERYVASNPENEEIFFTGLTWTSKQD